MMHCCGGYGPFIPDMIEIGQDGLQTLQPDASSMVPENLKEKYGDKIILNGSIDSHYALIEGTPASIFEATKKALEVFKPGGNFILSPSHDYLLKEMPLENVLTIYDTAWEMGEYKPHHF